MRAGAHQADQSRQRAARDSAESGCYATTSDCSLPPAERPFPKHPVPSIPDTSSCPTPVLGLHRTQPVANPLIELAKHLGRLRKLEGALPARQASPQSFNDLRQAAPTRTSRHFPEALLEGRFGFVGNLAPDLTAWTIPEGIAQEFPDRSRSASRHS